MNQNKAKTYPKLPNQPLLKMKKTAIYPVTPAAIPDFLFYKQLPVISPLSPTS